MVGTRLEHFGRPQQAANVVCPVWNCHLYLSPYVGMTIDGHGTEYVEVQ